MDGQFSSLKYLELVINMLPTETTEQTITDTLLKLSSLVKNYVPSEKCAESSKMILDTLLTCLVSNADDNIRGPIVDNMMMFISDPGHV